MHIITKNDHVLPELLGPGLYSPKATIANTPLNSDANINGVRFSFIK